MKITLRALIDPKSKESSKRYIIIILTYFLMLLSALLFLPYDIQPNNFELLKIIVGAFTLIIITGFGANAAENVKQINEDGYKKDKSEQEVH